MKNIIETLQKRKTAIEADKTKRDKLQGRLDQAMLVLKDKFNCSSLDEADEKYEDQKTKLDAQKAKIEKRYTELEEKYAW